MFTSILQCYDDDTIIEWGQLTRISLHCTRTPQNRTEQIQNTVEVHDKETAWKHTCACTCYDLSMGLPYLHCPHSHCRTYAEVVTSSSEHSPALVYIDYLLYCEPFDPGIYGAIHFQVDFVVYLVLRAPLELGLWPEKGSESAHRVPVIPDIVCTA